MYVGPCLQLGPDGLDWPRTNYDVPTAEAADKFKQDPSAAGCSGIATCKTRSRWGSEGRLV